MREKKGDDSHIPVPNGADEESLRRGMARAQQHRTSLGTSALYACMAAAVQKRGGDEGIVDTLFMLASRLEQMVLELGDPSRTDSIAFGVGSALEDLVRFVEFRTSSDIETLDRAGYDSDETSLSNMSPEERWRIIRKARSNNEGGEP